MKPLFEIGRRVRVDERDQRGHVRTPHYIRGKRGVVSEVCGPYPNPEELAQGRLGLPYRILYRVSFMQHDVWPDYRGGDADRVLVDLYEHWLEDLR